LYVLLYILPAEVKMRKESQQCKLTTKSKSSIVAFHETSPNIDHHCKSNKKIVTI